MPSTVSALPLPVARNVLSFLASEDILIACRYLFSGLGSALYDCSLSTIFPQPFLAPFFDPDITLVDTSSKLFSYFQVYYFIKGFFVYDLDIPLDRLMRCGLFVSLQWSRLLSRYPSFVIHISWKGLSHAMAFGPYELQRHCGIDPVRCIRLLTLRIPKLRSRSAGRAAQLAANIVVTALVWRARHREAAATVQWVIDSATRNSSAVSVLDAESVLSDTPSLDDLLEAGDGDSVYNPFIRALAGVSGADATALPPADTASALRGGTADAAGDRVVGADAAGPVGDACGASDATERVAAVVAAAVVGAVALSGHDSSLAPERTLPEGGTGGTPGTLSDSTAALLGLRPNPPSYDGPDRKRREMICNHLSRSAEIALNSISNERTVDTEVTGLLRARARALVSAAAAAAAVTDPAGGQA